MASVFFAPMFDASCLICLLLSAGKNSSTPWCLNSSLTNSRNFPFFLSAFYLTTSFTIFLAFFFFAICTLLQHNVHPKTHSILIPMTINFTISMNNSNLFLTTDICYFPIVAHIRVSITDLGGTFVFWSWLHVPETSS